MAWLLQQGAEDVKQFLELRSSGAISSTQIQPHPGATLLGEHLGGHRPALTLSHCREQVAVCAHVPTLPVSLPACCPPLAQEPAVHPLVSSGTTMAQCHQGTKSLENSSAQSKRIYQEKPLCAQQEPTTDIALWEHLALQSILTDVA